MGPEPSTNESNFAVEPYAGNTEPKLWFQKLVIRRGGERQDRAITFTRGLNIIWSERKVGDDRSLNAGNTSLTRLLRFCLGEDHFGTAIHERRVQAKFPQGAVAAQLRLAKTDWWIVRSLSDSSQRIAVSCELLENPWAELQRPRDESFNEFQQKIHEVFRPAIPAHNSSEVAMGFVARDHEGGFDNVFRWRAAHNNSGPGIREDLRVWALCALLGFKAWNDSAAPEPSHSVKPSASTAEPHSREDILAEIAERLGTTVGPHPDITTLLEQSQRDEARATSALGSAQERLVQLVELEKLQADLLQLDSRFATVDRLLKAKAKLKLRANGKCGLVKQKVTELIKDKKCLLKRVGCYLDQDAEVSNLRKEIGDIDEERSQIRQRITELKGKVGAGSGKGTQAAIAAQKDAVDKRQTALVEAHAIAQTLENLSEPGKPATSDSESDTPSRSDEGVQDAEQQKQEPNENFAEFVETYRRVVSRLISPTAAKALKDPPGGIYDLLEENELGSKESLMRLWAFDMAALLRSIEAPIHLPGLLIHDSPKQEDLADEEYWGLFRFAQLLEQGDQDNALFQYIITSSTPPPDELRDNDHVRLHLAPGTKTRLNPDTGEEEDDGYLFRCRFWRT